MSGFGNDGWSPLPDPCSSSAIANDREFLLRLFRASPVAILISALDGGRIIDANDAFLRLFTVSREALIGRTTVELGLWLDPAERARFLAAFDPEGGPRERELTLPGSDGEPRTLLATCDVVHDRGTDCLLTQFYDITERTRAEAARQAAEARFRRLVEQLPVITYTVELDASVTMTYISPQVARVLGFTPEEVLAGQPDFLRRRAHPDDMARLGDGIEQTMRDLGPFLAEYRMLTRDGRWVWIRDEASVVRDADGRPKHWQGVMVDVTEQRQTALALSESEERFRSAFDDSAIGMALVTPEGGFLRVNRAFGDILGYDPEELNRLSIAAITHPEDLANSLASGDRLWAGETDSYQLEKRYVRKDGRIVWGLLTSASVKDEDGTIKYATAQVQDITQRKQLEAQLRELASHDPLTGLYNRSALLERIGPALAGRAGLAAVLFVDLDGFKSINDALGHHAGDLLLIEVGRRLRESVRASDSVARLGGDEFVVLLPWIAGPDDAVAVAGRIVEAVARPVAIDGREARVRASVGVAIAETGGCTVEDVLRQADVALYRAKAAREGAFVVTHLPRTVGTGYLRTAS